MNTIFKYRLQPGNNCVTTKAGAVFLSVIAQDDTIQCWAMVDTNAAPEPRQLYLAQTGEALVFPPDSLKFIGTVKSGWWIGHLFEVIP